MLSDHVVLQFRDCQFLLDALMTKNCKALEEIKYIVIRVRFLCVDDAKDRISCMFNKNSLIFLTHSTLYSEYTQMPSPLVHMGGVTVAVITVRGADCAILFYDINII